MKCAILFLVIIGLAPRCFASNTANAGFNGNTAAVADTPKTKAPPKAPPSWFEENVTIGQSMATSEQQALPAQFTVTLPQNKPSSYLVNLGVNVNPGFLSSKQTIVSLFTGEFHRNTMTDSVQDNFQIGIKTTWDLTGSDPREGTNLILITDPQYIVDRVKMQNSIASNFLFTWTSDGGPFNSNTNNFLFDKRGSIVPKLLAGAQVQQVFAGDTTAAHGFKLRPLATLDLTYNFLKAGNIIDPVISVLADYTQRIAAVNYTGDGEKWTHLFRAEADYYILLKPVKLSVGVTFLNGSDIFAGLKQQQYFLLSLNVFAGGK